jgi:hypothetical protein
MIGKVDVGSNGRTKLALNTCCFATTHIVLDLIERISEIFFGMPCSS